MMDYQPNFIRSIPALNYYRGLRRLHGYEARTACVCAIMRYSHSKAEAQARFNRVATILDRFDLQRGKG